jgi:uncharacterized delta-60 repeat protein
VNFAKLLVTRFEANGVLDSSFGSAGRVVTDADAVERGEPVSVTVDSDGRILVLAEEHLLRFLPNGQFDETFGDHGVVALAGGQFAAMALQPDGMTVVGGRTNATPWSFLLERVRPDGTPDPGFGSGGVVTTAFRYFAWIRGLGLQPDGRIVAIGGDADVLNHNGAQVALARYLADGQLDPSFGSGGRVWNESCRGGVGERVAVSNDGRITAAGTSLVRYLPDGSLDPSFAGGEPVPLRFDASALSLQPDGAAIVEGDYAATLVEGRGAVYGPVNGAIVRVLPNGNVDHAFGIGGVADAGQSGVAVALDSAGRIDVAGATPDDFNSHIALARLLPDGRPDQSFIPPQGSTVDELRTLSTPGGGLRTLLQADSIPVATLSPDHRRVALVRSVDGRLELDVIGVDGKGLRQLLVSPFRGHELTAFPGTTLSWSPDGRHLAFDAWPVPLPAPGLCSVTPSQGVTYVIDVANRRLRRLDTGLAPEWSPDGRRIAIQDGLTLVVERPDGAARRVIGTGNQLSWSPSGSRVAFVDLDQWISVVSLSARRKHRLAIGRGPVWSPGGGRIGYERFQCRHVLNTDCLNVVGADGKGLVRLARFRGDVFGPATWSRDGTHIAVPVWLRPSPPSPTGRPWKLAVVAVKSKKTALYGVADGPLITGAPVEWGDDRTFFFVLHNIPDTNTSRHR